MSDGMEEFRETFFTECAELLLDMEERLLGLEEGEQNLEELNAIFRCAHSIKGGAGAFGMDAVMKFTHIMEALLDAMRDGKIVPSRDSIDLLLKSADLVTQMLEMEKAGESVDMSYGQEVKDALAAITQGKQVNASALSSSAIAAPAAKELREKLYMITFTPHPDLFASGNDPMLILRELDKLGTMEAAIDMSAVPAFNELEPTTCYLSWLISLFTKKTRKDIEEVFEFVNDISVIDISCETPDIEAEELAALEADDSAVEAPEMQADEAVSETEKKAPVTKARKAPPVSVASTIRVDLEKVDKLVNMAGELVITEAMIRDQINQLPAEQHAALLRGVDELSHHTRELQEAVMAVRMQPVKSIFSRLPRVVRDTASQLGKEIQLVLSGENTEVDKTVIEQLGDPLTHMIRNSCDHGIEMPDKRKEHGKSAQGTIVLSAYHQSGRIMIEITDDGAGINREKVLQIAKEKDVVAEDAQLTPEEIDHLIFAPGFSTAAEVTSVSGRGVGMDVVKRNIESLGGSVHITNNPGKGSVFSVSLPLTLAILDGMIVRVGRENYIVPITSIIETLRPRADEVRSVVGGRNVMNVRGEFIPLIYLHEQFDVADAEHDASNALVVLVENGRNQVGIVVDELLGQQQVVIKSLEENADKIEGVSGATILGDGKVSLILDIPSLCRIKHERVTQPKMLEMA